MTRPATRAEAAKQGATHGSGSKGLREWLEALDRGRHRQLVATFDTRVNKVRHLPGSAAKSAVKALRRHDYSSAVKQESFYVVDTSGPLVEGELERAQAWGAQLGEVARENFADATDPVSFLPELGRSQRPDTGAGHVGETAARVMLYWLPLRAVATWSGTTGASSKRWQRGGNIARAATSSPQGNKTHEKPESSGHEESAEVELNHGAVYGRNR